ncbi:MAG: deoxyribodipyrimidine photo-lyase [Thermodesulfobacteriales bacterium]|jgi:deoxyribodipyrimidine photo-lyase|nr:MAG: deoxyribodipyrimidine photo-lyase [Thermodesulfobacteriales bacterium]
MRNERAIFWFKRDLRTEDNTGLFHAISESREVLPIYVLDDEILKDYPRNSKRLGFFFDALKKLNKDLRELGSYLFVERGKAEEVIPRIVRTYSADSIYCNRAYGFSGISRDIKIERFAKSIGLRFKKFDDTFLVPPENIEQRKVFTPFYSLWRGKKKEQELPKLQRINSPEILTTSLQNMIQEISHTKNTLWPIDYPEQRLWSFNFKEYYERRDFPYIDGTSRLSPYLRFGTVSVRKVYNAAINAMPEPSQYVAELAWREFWYHIMHYFPETKDVEFQEKRRNIKWINNESWYSSWKEGRTGYPIVDAAMRQLKEEGWMHGRARMIVASFLTKDLLTDWRWGDKHFREHLIDYDETVDVGNWQWAASCGADPKPLRILNPILQSQQVDPECKYIKTYIPELRDLTPEKIHNPLTYKLPYHEPIVNHYEMRNLAHEAYSGGRIDDDYISKIQSDEVFTKLD